MASTTVMPNYGAASPYSTSDPRRGAPVSYPAGFGTQITYPGSVSPNPYGTAPKYQASHAPSPIMEGYPPQSYQQPYYNSTPMTTMPPTYNYTSGMNEIGGYQPQGAVRIQFGVSPTGGMVPTYDMYAVPTFEAPLTVQTDGQARAAQAAGTFGAMGAAGTMAVNQRGISMSSMDEVSRTSRSTKRMTIKTASAKPEKAGGWCC